MKLNTKKVLIGTDFELFIVNNEDKFISAIPFIEGTKGEPQVIDEKGNALQHDGVLFEANCPPVDICSQEEMWSNIQFVQEQATERLPEGTNLKCCTNGKFEDDELTDPEARVAGCTPSFNAWNNGEVEQSPNFEKTNERCAGFHVHVSHPGMDVASGMRLIRLLDVYLGLPLVLIDDDNQRRHLYGRMGSFRFKDYGDVCGVEYRVLSNVVIKNKEIFDFVWEGIKLAIKKFNEGLDYLEYKDKLEKAIDKYDFDHAAELCDELKIPRLEAEELEKWK